jgi:hypothetical protein
LLGPKMSSATARSSSISGNPNFPGIRTSSGVARRGRNSTPRSPKSILAACGESENLLLNAQLAKLCLPDGSKGPPLFSAHETAGSSLRSG